MITQADRDAIAQWLLTQPEEFRCSTTSLWKLLSRHREQAEAKTVAKIATWLRENSAEICDWSPPTIAAAIIDREWK